MTFFNMSCLGVILQVRGHDGVSTPHNGAPAYSVSGITYLPGRFLVSFPAVFTARAMLALQALYYRVPTQLGDLENSWNIVNLENSWKTPGILC